jgi:hypothetical protein
MSSILGPGPILDFDGTLAHLPVDWQNLRTRLGVRSIDELWLRPSPQAFAEVTEAEVVAADYAEGIDEVLNCLASVETFAILTSNSAHAVHRFLRRHATLAVRLSDVVGREELGGPKTDFARFRPGLQRCIRAVGTASSEMPPVYVANSAYELVFARRLGAVAVDVAELVVNAQQIPTASGQKTGARPVGGSRSTKGTETR